MLLFYCEKRETKRRRRRNYKNQIREIIYFIQQIRKHQIQREICHQPDQNHESLTNLLKLYWQPQRGQHVRYRHQAHLRENHPQRHRNKR